MPYAEQFFAWLLDDMIRKNHRLVSKEKYKEPSNVHFLCWDHAHNKLLLIDMLNQLYTDS